MKTQLAIGIDVGGTTIKSGVAEEGLLVRRGAPIDTQKYASADELIEALVRDISELKKAEPRIAAVGVGLPGIVDSESGIVHRLSNVPGWNDVPLRGLLRDR